LDAQLPQRLPKYLFINLCNAGDLIYAEAYTDQQAAAQAINECYVETIFAIETATGRNFGFNNLRGLWDQGEAKSKKRWNERGSCKTHWIDNKTWLIHPITKLGGDEPC